MTITPIAFIVDLPSDLAGWALVVSILGGLFVGATKLIVSSETKPIKVRLDSIDLRLTTQDGELQRVREIEAKIENGLSHRTERIEDRQIEMQKELAEVKSALTWDGTERRK